MEKYTNTEYMLSKLCAWEGVNWLRIPVHVNRVMIFLGGKKAKFLSS